MKTVQILTGKRGLGHFVRAREVVRLLRSVDDCVRPGSHLVVVGTDQARRYPGPLPPHYRVVSGDAPTAAAMIRELLALAQPDVVFVDNRPEGPRDALLFLPPTEMRRLSPDSRIVLATRDVLDSPLLIRKAWSSGEIRRLINDYDDVWCFGDQDVFDLASQYNLRRSVRYVGYLAAPVMACSHSECLTAVTVTAGGGEDSKWTIDAVRALETVLPLQNVRVLVGPHAPARVRAFMRAKTESGLRIAEHHHGISIEPACGRTVVGMAGYNTVAETLRSGRRLVVVPRTSPTAEQMIRAEALARRGNAEILPVDDMSRLLGALRSSLWAAQEFAGRGLPLNLADERAIADACLSLGSASGMASRA